MATPSFQRQLGINNPLAFVLLGATENSPILVDINGDGDLDVFVGSQDGNIRFFSNSGTVNNPSFAISPVSNPSGLADVGDFSTPTFVDVDADGDFDAFVGNSNGNTIFFRNVGTLRNPNFTTALTNPFGLTNVGARSKPTFVDIDNDSDLDVFIGNSNGDVQFFRNIGNANNPSFEAAVNNPFGLTNIGTYGEFLASPTFIDADGDGDLDLFMGTFRGNILFFNNIGNASNPNYAPAIINPFGLTNAGGNSSQSKPAFADIDGDGDLDLFVGGSTGNGLVFFRNTAMIATIAPGTNPSESGDVPVDGTFVISLNQAAPLGGLTVTYIVQGTATPTDDYNALSGSVFIAAGQTSGTIHVTPVLDKLFDPYETVVVSLTTDAAAVYTLGSKNSASLTIADQTLPNFLPPLTNPWGLTSSLLATNSALVDIDSDGDLDLFIGSFDGNTQFLRNNGSKNNPIFAAPTVNPFGFIDIGDSSSVSFTDIDGDGDQDAFMTQLNGDIKFFRNIGNANNPSFIDNGINSLGFLSSGTIISISFVDIDSDGDLDAFLGNITGSIQFFRNLGTTKNPLFSTGQSAPFGLDPTGSFLSITFADIDGDGDQDAFIRDNTSNLQFFRNIGNAINPSFASALANPFGITLLGAASVPTFGDLDADNDLDALVTLSSGNISYLENAPTVTISANTDASEANGIGTFVVTMNQPAPDGGTTIYYTVGGTATNGVD